MTTLITNGTVVTAEGQRHADVLIEGEQIAGVAPNGAHEWTADRAIDATGKYVMPGGVDIHTHFELPMGPGVVSCDTFESGTRAAAWGGTTTIVDFAVQTIGEPMMDGFDEWMAKAEGNCAIDYGFHMSVADVNERTVLEMARLVEAGVTSFKLFMAYPGRMYSTDGQILEAMQEAARLGATVMMHAENGLAVDVLRAEAVARGDTDPIHHSLTRPPELEAEAVHRSVILAELAGCPLYVVHISAKEAAAEVAEAKARGLPVFGETCPQYLFLDWEHLRLPGFEGAKYVCSPPVRNRADGHHQALWDHLVDDELQVVSTDHASFTFDPQKRLGEGDFTKIPNGLPGVEDRMRLIYHGGVGEGRFDPSRFVEITATSPAKMFGLYPQKGTIEEGSDADIVVWDPNATHTMSVQTSMSNADYNCYEGLEVTGDIELVMARGAVIVEGGEYTGSPGDGRYLPRGTCQLL